MSAGKVQIKKKKEFNLAASGSEFWYCVCAASQSASQPTQS